MANSRSLRDLLSGKKKPTMADLTPEQRQAFSKLAQQAAPYEKLSDAELIAQLQRLKQREGIDDQTIAYFAQQLMPMLSSSQQTRLRQVLQRMGPGR